MWKASGIMTGLRGGVDRLIRWARTHKFKAALLLVGLFLFVELLTIPFFSIARLRTENPRETALMRQRMREAEDAHKSLKITQRWIPLSRIPRHVIDAVVVAEDGTFYEHQGIDWYEVQESIEKNLDEGRMARGASTITQQLAKNLYLSTSKDPVRKVKELLITLLLERVLTKPRILELYLNVIEWGDGIYGAEAAARTYFATSSGDLSREQAAALAAVIINPRRYSPAAPNRRIRNRIALILERMQQYQHYRE